MEQIFKGEGTSDIEAKRHGYKSGYDVTFNYGEWDGGEHKPITQMTLKEIDHLQTKILRNKNNHINSSAVGKLQITRTTLRYLKSKYSWNDDTIFSKEFQQGVFKLLLNIRGLHKFKSGKISLAHFQNNLAKEWASVARADTGKSHHDQRVGSSSKIMHELLTEIYNEN